MTISHPPSWILHLLAYVTSPNLRATASEASLDHDVLYSGTRPEARIASAHPEATRGPSPRPRNASAVSRPASAAASDRHALKQALTAYPSSTTATIGVRDGISLAVHPVKWWSSDSMSSIKTVPAGWTISSGNVNAGPESTSPRSSDMYRSACTGASRKSETGGSSRAKPSSSSAIFCGTSTRTAQAQLSFPRTRRNSGPSHGS